MGIFEEPENQRVLLDLKIYKKMIFSQSRLDMAMQGCILMLRVGEDKSIWTSLRARKSESIPRRQNTQKDDF